MIQKTEEQISLNLVIGDEIITKYLAQFEKLLWEEKAQEAMRVGVIAIQSASPSLDTRIVEEKFSEIERELKDYTQEFKRSLQQELKKYFEKDKGDLPLSLDSVFGARGKFSVSLKDYFDSDSGKVVSLIRNKIGPGSEFAKSLDPSDKESVVSKIEKIVKDKLETVIGDLIGEFSLDKTDSGMSRMKKLLEDKVREIKQANDNFFNEVRGHFNIQKAKMEEAEKGTQKGRDFESILYDKVALLGQQLEDTTENVTGTVGEIPRSKVGDYVIALGNTSAAPGKRIVVEVKQQQGYKLNDAIEELKVAKENRKADCGIFIFAKGYEPIEMGDFKINENDFFCTVDEEFLQGDRPVVFLEAAYKIARVYIITQLRKEKKGKVDLEGIENRVKKMLTQVESMSDLLTKARTIQNNGISIEKTAETIKNELEFTIQSVLELLKTRKN